MELSMQKETTQLALVPERELTPQIWTMIMEMAPVMYKSRLFGVTSQEAAAAIILKGYELGLSITASFELVQVVQGKPALSPRGAMALLLNSPKIKELKVTQLVDSKGAYLGHECYMRRDNGFEYTSRFTLEDAKRAGLIKPGSGWESYPQNMCQWRAIGFTADVVAPDITSGMTAMMKMPEQFGVTLTDQGNIVELQAQPAAVSIPAVEQAAPALTLDQLCEIFGAEAIMVANMGKVPATDEEVAQVAAKLAGGQ
jgi:hypothetical protein